MTSEERHIQIQPGGPYLVRGGVPLVRKRIVESEHGESMTWVKEGEIEAGDSYALCRCGHSSNKPFCDGTHTDVGIDEERTAPDGRYAERAKAYEGTGIVMEDDRSICSHAGFCTDRVSNAWKLISKDEVEDSRVRSRVIAMIERCPSGALTYRVEEDGQAIEPDLPAEIAVTPDGYLWVSGAVPIRHQDGEELEARNRVTLCRCGASEIKPLCDGSHADIDFEG